MASYRLDARLDAETHQVQGTGEIVYRNPSGDTLGEVWLRLYLNAFRHENTPWMREAGREHRANEFDPAAPGWIRLDRLWLAETGEALPLPEGGDTESTIVQVPLPRPLPPGGTLRLGMEWTSQLPRVFARTGFSGDFHMAGQWYPKLAVYDRGAWDTEPFHANGEFFHDFGDYELQLTVPSGWVTGASGTRQGEQDLGDGTRRVSYRAERVTDVAWTAWPGYVVVERELTAAGQRVPIELLLPPREAQNAERHLAAAQQALDAFGRWYGAYPWPKLTLVVPPPGAEGAAGMEYPTLVSTGRVTELPFGLGAGVYELEIVTVHEIAHQWFPLQVQSNEAREPWLDEGFADYLTTRVLDRWLGRERSVVDLPFGRFGYGATHRLNFLGAALREPLRQPAWALPPNPYGATMYSKGATALATLEGVVGDERLTAALRDYAERWRWRHPTTDDLRVTLEDSLGERLDWFFGGFVDGRQAVNYRVAELSPDRAVVQRTGDARVPVDIAVVDELGQRQVVRWDGSGDEWTIAAAGAPIRSVAVDPERRLGLQVARVDDAQSREPNSTLVAALLNRWLSGVQWWLQAMGQIG